eukprot:1058443-Prorocentrum_minimum.AAC.1
MHEISRAWREASEGVPASRPVVEMTIPSALDTTLAPPGKHVVQLFVQFAPYDVHPKEEVKGSSSNAMSELGKVAPPNGE